MEQCRGGCSHEMVNSPATAATMAYPSLEEERRSSGHENGNDHDHRRRHRPDAIRIDHETEKQCLDPFCAVCSSSVDPCIGCPARNCTPTVLNRDFAHSYRPVPETSEGRSLWDPSECPWPDGRIGGGQRRSRKQSQPRKVTLNEFKEEEEEEEEEDMSCSDENTQDERQEGQEESSSRPTSSRMLSVRFSELKNRYRERLTARRLLKCRLCPVDSLARGSICRPYHTKASLTLHKLWRHERRRRIAKNCVSKDRPLNQVSSITLKATVFTSPGYGYHR